MLIGVTGAPVFTFKFPVAPYNNATDEEMAIVSEYYLTSARFLSIYIGSFFSWDFFRECCPAGEAWDNAADLPHLGRGRCRFLRSDDHQPRDSLPVAAVAVPAAI